jgi:hypothetical protein
MSSALHELQICRLVLGISHLPFADDTLLFLEATEEQASAVNKTLHMYERCMGQLINPSKCSVMFGSTCPPMNQDRVKEVLNLENIALEEKYLGLPTPKGRMKKDKFVSLKERLTKRFTNWVERNMSLGAKELLIKLVAQAIRQAYAMR